MSKRIHPLGLLAASVAVGGLFLCGSAAQAAPVAAIGSADPTGPVASVPAVHKLHGRIVAVSSPAGNVGPTITVAMHKRHLDAVDGSQSATPKMLTKTFPIAAGAPIELFTGDSKQSQTPDALQPGRRVALLVSDGVVNEIDLFAQPLPATDAATVTNYFTTYSPYRFFRTGGFGRHHHRFIGWNYGRGNWFAGYNHGHTFVNRGISGGVAYRGHRHAGHGHVVHYRHGVHKSGAGQKTMTGHHSHVGHHGKAGHGVKVSHHSQTGKHGKQGHKVGHHHGAHGHAGHHAHTAGHKHRSGHRSGHHAGHHASHRSGGHHRK